MSLFLSLVLVAIAWFLSALVDGIPQVWHIFSAVPLSVLGVIFLAILAWIISRP